MQFLRAAGQGIGSVKFIFSTKFFPAMIIALQTAAAIRFSFDHDWRRVIYFLAADLTIGSVSY